MQTSGKFQIIPITDDNQKLEVLLEETGQITLRLSTWTEGLGWCRQKTMNFDQAMLDDLQRALTVARHNINRQKIENGQEIQSAKVIRLPFAA